jgi:hypothetical protein
VRDLEDVGLVDRGDLLAAFGGELEGDVQSGGWPTPVPCIKFGAPYLNSEIWAFAQRQSVYSPSISNASAQLLLLGNGK